MSRRRCGPVIRCRYHETGGPESIRCGPDTFTGFGSKAASVLRRLGDAAMGAEPIDTSALGTEREAQALRDLIASEKDPVTRGKMQARLADVEADIRERGGHN